MNRLILSTTMTVDGVISVSEWYVSEGDHDRAAREQFEQAAAMLLGRKTYEGLAAFWSTETGPWADVLNPMPKFVASRTRHGALDWNATTIDGDLTQGVSRLREELDGDLMLIGCGELARNLLAAGSHRRAAVLGTSRRLGSRRTAVSRRRPSAARARRVRDVRFGRRAASLQADGRR